VESSDFPVDRIVDEVLHRLEHMEPAQWTDVYVWSDGSVTGPKDMDSDVAGLKLVSLFTPTDRLPEPAAVRKSIVDGLVTVDS
jgi:hypothetical protein